jgi:hypothetical protein
VKDGASGVPPAGRWSTAVALWLVALLIPVVNPLMIVLLGLGALTLAFPPRGRWVWHAVALGLALTVLVTETDVFGTVARGWSLLLAGIFVATMLLLPGAGFITRALAALGGAAAVSGLWLLALGGDRVVDTLVTQRFHSVALLATGMLAERGGDPGWSGEFGRLLVSGAEMQGYLFLGLLGLESLAALALAWWLFVRSRPEEEGRWSQLRPLKEFRFNDQLVWLAIAGLALVALPLGDEARRAGANALAFMGGLYALRGFGVLAFIAGAAASRGMTVFVAAMAVLLFPILIPMTAVLVGLGDTWLDVRRRITAAAGA